MTSLLNSARLLFLPVALLLVLSPCPVAAASATKCHSIYKGFAQCLMALGDSLVDNAHNHEDMNEIHSICKSWDEFHLCANEVMAGCPQEAAAVWKSLRQESKKMQFSGNLYDMCSKHRPAGPTAGTTGPADTNKESLRAAATALRLPTLLPPLLLSLLLLWI